jgi:hypothetical protein
MDLKLDGTGDLDTTGGELSLVTGAEAMAQQGKMRLRMLLGEWHLDQRQGMPWLQIILAVKPFPAEYAISKIRQALLGVPGIVGVRNLSVTPEVSTRQASVSFEAVGNEGLPVAFEEFVLP